MAAATIGSGEHGGDDVWRNDKDCKRRSAPGFPSSATTRMATTTMACLGVSVGQSHLDLSHSFNPRIEHSGMKSSAQRCSVRASAALVLGVALTAGGSPPLSGQPCSHNWLLTCGCPRESGWSPATWRIGHMGVSSRLRRYWITRTPTFGMLRAQVEVGHVGLRWSLQARP